MYHDGITIRTDEIINQLIEFSSLLATDEVQARDIRDLCFIKTYAGSIGPRFRKPETRISGWWGSGRGN